MKNKYTIITTNTFKHEIKKIYDYISINLDQPLLAYKFHKHIAKQISSLEFMPERFMKLINKKRNLHRLPINKYVVIYEVNNNTRTSIYFTHLSW